MKLSHLLSCGTLLLGLTVPAYGGYEGQPDYVLAKAEPKLVPDADAVYLKSYPESAPAKGVQAIAIPNGFNWPQWTIEAVLRVPADAKDNDLKLGGWTVGKETGYTVNLDAAQLRIVLARPPKQGSVRFDYSIGGNGMSVARNSGGRWIHVAWGVDAPGQRAGLIARELSGNLLDSRVNFAPTGGLRLRGNLAGDEKAQAERQAWQELSKALADNPVEALEVGGTNVELRQVRISKCYRAELFELRSDLLPLETRTAVEAIRQSTARSYTGGTLPPDPLTIGAKDIDPPRARTQIVGRDVGYRGYRDYTGKKVEESFIPLSAGDPQLPVRLPKLKPSLYVIYLSGMIDPRGRDNLERIWRPCAVAFELLDANGKKLSEGRMPLKQSFLPRRLQGFNFHIEDAGDYTVTLRMTEQSQESVRLLSVTLVDLMDGLPDVALKTGQMVKPTPAEARRLDTLDDARKQRDDLIWNSLPPLNVPLQVHGTMFRSPPAGVKLTDWSLAAIPAVDRRANQTFARLDMVNSDTGEKLTQAQIAAGVPWAGDHPDDGTGIYLTRKDFPDLAQDASYYTPRAVLLGQRVQIMLGLLGTWDHRGLSLPAKYFASGDAQTGHDAAMLLARLAYDWPAIEMSLHELRANNHSPDLEFNTDWTGSRRNGKYFYDGWSGGTAMDLLDSYDQIFPYIKDNQVLADAVHRFIPWVKTPQDVVRLLDRYLVFTCVRDFNRGLIRAAPVEDKAGQLLGYSKLTERWFDLTRQAAVIYPMRGTFQEMYATAMPRIGAYYIGSTFYARGASGETVEKANMLADAKGRGLKPVMDLTDVQRYPKVRTGGDYVIDAFVAGGFMLPIGDASGGPHAGPMAASRMERGVSEAAVRLWGDKRHAWILANLFKSTDPAVAKLAKDVPNPLLHNPSRVIPNEVAIVELGVQETDLTRKTAAIMRVGIGQGHAHNDQLSINFYALGVPASVGLACRNEGGNWSRPGAGWGFLHNHAISHDDQNPARAGGRQGEPWLTAFQPPLMRGRYVSANGKETLDRDLLLMEIGESGQYYAFDIQRITGGRYHTWCFHGCESHDLTTNADLKAVDTHPWLTRLLEGTRKVGTVPAAGMLQAEWTLNREGRDYPHNFVKPGVVKTVAAEQAVLGKAFDAAKPPVHVRASVLNVAGDEVTSGNAYSQSYAYCFPFLWSQHEVKDGAASIYPAVYEWYRGGSGGQPVIAKFEKVSDKPLVVRVTTTSGQVDTYGSGGDGQGGFWAVSTDAKGLRWAKINGQAQLDFEGLKVRTARASFSTPITDIDYVTRKLTTRDDLPADPYVQIGNPGRRSNLQLKGGGSGGGSGGKQFTWADDLLIHEGEITSISVVDDLTVKVETNQKLLFEGSGNRKAEGFTQVNESHTWQFRGGKVIKRPPGAGAKLSAEVFTDANNDGLVNLKTYEIGLGNQVDLPADITLRRTPGGDGFESQSNVPFDATIASGGGTTLSATPSTQWRKLTPAKAPAAPSRG